MQKFAPVSSLNSESFPLLSDEQAIAMAGASPREVVSLAARAAELRDAVWGRALTYSPKIFLPLTNLCRNRCDYCAFRRSPGDAGEWTMTHADVDDLLARGASHGCIEALFCLGDTPETAFPSYRTTLAEFGHGSTVDYLEWACDRALSLGLLPHTNAGILTAAEMTRLRPVNVSLGLMLENVSERLCVRGMPHHRAPDKRPARRLRMLDDAGRLRIPFTTGILIGIGETRRERVEALLAIRRSHREHGHIQEVIVQNFDPHTDTRMSVARPPTDEDVAHAVALARLILDHDVSVQAPPNLNPERAKLLVESGINDFGGISPVTPDFINPDRPWPHVEALAGVLSDLGFSLGPRLPIYDSYIENRDFLDPSLLERVERKKASLRAPIAARPAPNLREAEPS